MPAPQHESRNMERHGTCPSCGRQTILDFLGIQRWPPRVAEKSGLPAEQTIWQCRNCKTTLMEASIKWNDEL